MFGVGLSFYLSEDHSGIRVLQKHNDSPNLLVLLAFLTSWMAMAVIDQNSGSANSPESHQWGQGSSDASQEHNVFRNSLVFLTSGATAD